jgi:hypothetical protein
MRGVALWYRVAEWKRHIEPWFDGRDVEKAWLLGRDVLRAKT